MKALGLKLKGSAPRKRIALKDVVREAKEEGHTLEEELKEKRKGPGRKALPKGLR